MFSLCILSFYFSGFSQEGYVANTKLIIPKTNSYVFGCNFIPSTAVNQLEMWQGETFDTATISTELRLAASIGMNTIRVFLHDLVYSEDSNGFLNRINIFLSLAERYQIKTLLVFFDSCWDPYPKEGKQPIPVAFRHNSHWVQSPGAIALKDSTQYQRLEKYVRAVVRKFANDERVFGWDVWNEPDNTNEGSYMKTELTNKKRYVFPLLKNAFSWIRSEHPMQPVTSGIWQLYGDWSQDRSLSSIERLQIENSDIITFHFYGNSQQLEKRIVWLKQFHKSIICTEFLARSYGNTFEDCLPVFMKYEVGAINWGLVSGKTQTIFPWDSWKKKYSQEPSIWHHDIFKKDGTPFSIGEIELIRSIIIMPRASQNQSTIQSN